MISPNSYSVTSSVGDIFLAPYDESHLQAALPVPDSLLVHVADASRPFYKNKDHALLMWGEEGLVDTATWGIFTSFTRSPDVFAGTISVSASETESESGEICSTLFAQEISRQIFRSNLQGKGLGTLANLAISQIVFGQETKVLYASTSDNNQPAQRSLAKSGFVHLSTDEHRDTTIDGQTAKMQQWWLASAQGLSAFSGMERSLVTAGYDVYARASAGVEVRKIGLKR